MTSSYKNRKPFLPLIYISITLSLLAPSVFADSTEKKEHLVVVGSRSLPRIITESTAPVDIISRSDIERTGLTETAKLLQTLIPSFNFSVSTISDGTDSVLPATLRGSYPDQVLVLINGKRRHNSALIHINGSVGRGAAGTDFNAIPTSAIERIEILRDGAAAQYGSDAIAGVINIILRKDTELTETEAYFGSTYQGDGEQRQYSFNTGFDLNNDGFLHITAENRSRNPTDRSGEDPRCQYSDNCDLDNDPREVAFNRDNHRFGNADSENDYLFFNMEKPLSRSATSYAFGGIARRDAETVGFYRRALDDRNNPNIYPDGFLPRINTEIDDDSISLGLRGDGDHWKWDTSYTYGQNTFDFFIHNSLNVSLGDNSPTSADAGGLVFSQNTVNLDLVRTITARQIPVNVAVGFEYRRDQFEINAGEPDSYRDGDVLNQSGGPGSPGIQVFPGFQPDNEINKDRYSRAMYFDLEAWLNSRWLAGGALRYEDYSDFGTNLSGKLSSRYQWSEHLTFRGTLSTGFRAPSLMQQFFNNTSTQFVNGIPAEVLTASNDHALVRNDLGIDELEEETSFSVGLGMVFDITDNLTLSADAYHIDIDDRILLSSRFDGNDSNELNTLLMQYNASRVQFFTNTVDTRTQGLDLTATWHHRFEHNGRLRLDAAANINSVEIIGNPDLLPGINDAELPLVGLTERTLLEDGQPKQSYNFTSYYTYGNHDITWRVKRYGSVKSIESDEPATKQTFGARWITDLEYTNHLTPKASWTIGANNLLDTRPERNMATTSFNGIFPYNRRVSPFGYNGGFYFTRLKVRF